MLKVISLSLMSLAFAACAVEEPTIEGETQNDELAIPDDLDVDLGEEGVDGRPYAQSYCVDQSYASANNVNCEFLPVCTGQPNYDTHLSRGHRVRMHNLSYCPGTYVHVVSLWNVGSCYHMRRDALRPC
jgi:hypothetical protein